MSGFTLRSILVLVFAAALVKGQQGRGTISGTVTDASGATVTNAALTIVNNGTNASFPAVSNDAGFYTVPALPVGGYTVNAEAKGFKKEVRTGITLQVDQHAEVDFRLEVGATAESIEVRGEASLVDTASATVGKVVENRRINDLPLNGRNVMALVMLTPGVKSQGGPTNSGFADRGITLSATSINGGPSALNSLLIDGGNNNTSYFGDINVNPTVDAVQEFKVQSNSMSAEFGLTAGGVINMVTKSGTNTPHGTAYEFLRNNALDARRAFTAFKEPYRYNQFGGAIGGPVVLPKIYNGRDRTFLFFNYEEWRYVHSQSNILSVPTPEQRNGDFSNLRDASGKLIPIYDPASTRANPNGSGFIRNAFTNNVIPRSRFDPVAVNMLQFWPTPNRTPSNAFTNSNNWIGQVGEHRSMRQWTLKGDERITDKNSLSVRYIYYRHFNDNGIASALPDPNVRERLDTYKNQNTVATDTHTFTPTFLNEARVSVARQWFPFQGYAYNQDWPQKLGLPASFPPYSLPRTVVDGLPGFGAFTVGLRGQLTWQFFEMATKIYGNHSLKFGMDIRLQQANNYQREVPSGQFNFTAALTGNPQSQAGTGSGLATFLLGDVATSSFIAYAGESEQGHSASFFIQDDWRVNRRLTINLGLRYDYQPPGYERHNGTSNFDPSAANPDNGLLGRMKYAGVDYGRTFLEPRKADLGPRIGVAYDLFGNERTVVRAGYAIFYPQIFYRDVFGNTAGFANTTTTYNPPGGNSNLPAFQFKDGFPSPYIQPLGARLGPSAFLGQSVTWDQQNEKNPRSQQWNFGISKQLPGQWVVDATYSGNKVNNLVSGSYEYNVIDPANYSLGLALQDQVPNPYAGKIPGALGGATIQRMQLLKPFPYYSSVSVRNPHLGESYYNALFLSVEKRLTHGMTFLASYTKAKLISDSVVTPENFGNVEQSGIVGYQNGKYNRAAERSLDPTDVADRLIMSGVFELPFGAGRRFKSNYRIVNGFLGGWQMNLIATLQNGNPVPISGANNNLATRPNSTGHSARLDTRSAEHWFNTAAFVNPPAYTFGNVSRTLPDVRNPGVVNFDLSLIKDTTIFERLKLQYRAEAFNFINHTNLGLVNANFVAGPNGFNQSSTFGTITSARDPRIIQMGLKLVF